MIAIAKPATALVKPTASPEPGLEYLSASRIGCWQTCSLKFWFRYVLKLKSKPTPALLVGQAVHRVLQAWNHSRWRKEVLDAASMLEAFNHIWQELAAEYAIPWGNVEEEQGYRDQAWSLLTLYVQATPIPVDERPEGVEVTVECELGNGLPPLIGVIDLVRAGGRITDYKTTAKTPSEGQAANTHETQLSCYSILYREATGHKEQALELHHLVKLKTPKLVITTLEAMTELQEARLRHTIQKMVKGVRDKDFTPSPGIHCTSCEFFARCRRWHPRELEGRAA